MGFMHRVTWSCEEDYSSGGCGRVCTVLMEYDV